MNDLLQQVTPDRLIEMGVFVGLFLGFKLTAASRMAQGKRIGALEDRMMRAETALKLQPLPQPPEGGAGG